MIFKSPEGQWQISLIVYPSTMSLLPAPRSVGINLRLRWIKPDREQVCFTAHVAIATDSSTLSSGFHPQTNGQMERANQKLEVSLRCITSQDPASWSKSLPWVEYAHNSLTTAAIGLSPFHCCLGYQPPLFPSQEEEVAVPSAQAFVKRCKRTWSRARTQLLRYSDAFKKQADRHRSAAPAYKVGQRVMLSTRNLPLKSPCRKLNSRFVGPFSISKVINPCAVRLVLPLAMRRINPTFHVSQVKPLVSSPL